MTDQELRVGIIGVGLMGADLVLPEHQLDLGFLVGGKLRGHGHGIPGILTGLPTPKGAH